MSERLPLPSDFPQLAEDEDDTLVWKRPTFLGAPLRPLPADETIEALAVCPQSTVRERRRS